MMTKIYALLNENNKIRYIGKTVNSLSKRLVGHLCQARRGIKNHRCCWIRSMLIQGFIPSIILVGEVEGNGSKEEIAWIKYFRDEGVDLVNETIGGEGVMQGRRHSEETRRKMSLIGKGRKKTEDWKRRIGESQIGKIISVETRHKNSAARKGKKLSVEHKEKLRLANLGNKSRLGKKFSIETLLKISNACKRMWALKLCKNEVET